MPRRLTSVASNPGPGLKPFWLKSLALSALIRMPRPTVQPTAARRLKRVERSERSLIHSETITRHWVTRNLSGTTVGVEVPVVRVAVVIGSLLGRRPGRRRAHGAWRTPPRPE